MRSGESPESSHTDVGCELVLLLSLDSQCLHLCCHKTLLSFGSTNCPNKTAECCEFCLQLCAVLVFFNWFCLTDVFEFQKMVHIKWTMLFTFELNCCVLIWQWHILIFSFCHKCTKSHAPKTIVFITIDLRCSFCF